MLKELDGGPYPKTRKTPDLLVKSPPYIADPKLIQDHRANGASKVDMVYRKQGQTSTTTDRISAQVV